MAFLRGLVLGALAARAGALTVEVERVQAGGTQENALAALAGTRVQDDVVTAHNLTICNAYADRKPLSAYTVNTRVKLTEEPIQYKTCKKISIQMEEGERIDFKLGGLSVGNFRAGGLPYVSSSLLIVPYHASNDTMTASITSHMFMHDDEKAQVAIIDAFAEQGHGEGGAKVLVKKGSSMRVEQAGGRLKQSVELKSGAVLKLKPGSYSFILLDENGKTTKTVPLDAQANAQYVVMHVGSAPDGTPTASSWEREQLLVSSSIGDVGSSASLDFSFGASFRASVSIFAAAAGAASLAAAMA